MNKIFTLGKLFLLAALFLWIPSAYKRSAHPFRASKCEVEWPFVPEWETASAPSQEIRELFLSPFTYLAKGKQSYVFSSNDGKYVLKLFRFNRCKAPYGQKCEALVRKWMGWRQKIPRKVPSRRISMTFESCYLAHTLASRQTGVVWAHLNLKKGGILTFVVKDRLGRSHTIDPSRHRFVLQQKAEPFSKALLKANSPEERLLLVQSFDQLLNELQSLHLANDDEKLGDNFGFLGDRAIVLDIGNFYYSPEFPPNEIAKFQIRLHNWFDRHFPGEL